VTVALVLPSIIGSASYECVEEKRTDASIRCALMSSAEAARFSASHEKTLSTWRSRGMGRHTSGITVVARYERQALES